VSALNSPLCLLILISQVAPRSILRNSLSPNPEFPIPGSSFPPSRHPTTALLQTRASIRASAAIDVMFPVPRQILLSTRSNCTCPLSRRRDTFPFSLVRGEQFSKLCATWSGRGNLCRKGHSSQEGCGQVTRMGDELLRSLDPPGVFKLSSRELLARRGSESLSASGFPFVEREIYQLPGRARIRMSITKSTADVHAPSTKLFHEKKLEVNVTSRLASQPYCPLQQFEYPCFFSHGDCLLN
jgi:hypothetical protein